MHALLLSLLLLGQAELPPAPAPVPDPQLTQNDSIDQMKTWLLTRLIVDSSFDAKKSAEAEQLINKMSEQQLRVLISVYKERMAKQQPASQQQPASPQQTDDQAKLNLQQLEAYRDHLKREYDRRLLQGYMTQNLVYQNIVNNQRMTYLANGPYTTGYGYGSGYGPMSYGPLGYGGLGYGVLNYGGFGYGAPGFGNPVIYGAPYGGVGMGTW